MLQFAMRFNLSLLFGLVICSVCAAASVEIPSPDGKLKVTINNEGGLNYSVAVDNEMVIQRSKLGITFRDRPAFGTAQTLAKSNASTFDETWTQPWGERKFIRNHYNEVVTQFKKADGVVSDIQIRWRVYNDGIGFRYEMQGAGNQVIAITDELTEFSLSDAQQTQAWWIPALGWNRYEFQYNNTPLNQLDRVHTPLTVKLGNGIHLSFHEAALVDFASMYLDQRRDGVLKAALVPRSDGLKVLTNSDFVSPWRTIQVARNAVGLLNSNLILNLNEPNKLGDVSWVEPGKYVGIWWGMHLGKYSWGSDGVHGATTERAKDYIDFAASYGFDGVLIEGWNLGWDGSWFSNGDVFNFTQSYPDFDLPLVSQYALDNGVRLVGHHETSGSVSNYEKQMREAYALYESHGVRQIKTGYVADGGGMKWVDDKGIERFEWHDSQFGVNHYLRSIKAAAQHRISINTHEPIKDTGLRRTYPNWLSREGARGQEFNAWGSPPNSPAHTVNLIYTRMLSGPMDFTPGIFNLAYEGLDAENRVQTTLAKQLALYVVLYSPIQMAADLPEHYLTHKDAFQFIVDVPTDWHNSIALQGEVGKFVVFARQQRESHDWYLGAITDEQARNISLALDFLEPDQRYEAQIYRDGEKADWKTNPYDFIIESDTVTSTDTLNLRMAPSGGFAIRFKKL